MSLPNKPIDHFKNALQEGLDRAKEAEQALEEIRDVLAALDEAIRAITDNRLSAATTFMRQGRGLVIPIMGIMEALLVQDPEDRTLQPVDVLLRIDSSTTRDDSRKICSLRYSDQGFPVTVIIEGPEAAEETCFDADSLTNSLTGVLQRAVTGRKIRALLADKAPQELKEAPSSSEAE